MKIVDGAASAADGAVLVTGATGFIGREIVRRLVRDGRRVIAAARARDGVAATRGSSPTTRSVFTPPTSTGPWR